MPTEEITSLRMWEKHCRINGADIT